MEHAKTLGRAQGAGLYNFATNCMILPPDDEIEEEDEEVITYLVAANTSLTKVELFDDIFQGYYDFLVVMPLPEFDVENMEEMADALKDYEDNSKDYAEGKYEIARQYH